MTCNSLASPDKDIKNASLAYAQERENTNTQIRKKITYQGPSGLAQHQQISPLHSFLSHQQTCSAPQDH